MADAKLLSDPTNYAVVHLPGRAFPGVVFQGDSLHTLIGDLKEAVAETIENERMFVLNEVIGRLESILKCYETVLSREGMSLPY